MNQGIPEEKEERFYEFLNHRYKRVNHEASDICCTRSRAEFILKSNLHCPTSLRKIFGCGNQEKEFFSTPYGSIVCYPVTCLIGCHEVVTLSPGDVINTSRMVMTSCGIFATIATPILILLSHCKGMENLHAARQVLDNYSNSNQNPYIRPTQSYGENHVL